MRHRRVALMLVVGLVLAGLQAAFGAGARAAASAPSLVQSSGATETKPARALTARFRSATAAGDLLVLSASVHTGTARRITSVTDSAGNKWTRAGRWAVRGHDSDGELWYAAAARPTSRVTVHTRSSVTTAIDVREFRGVAATSPLDATAGAHGRSTSAASGRASGAQVGDLVVGFVAGHGSAQAMTVTGTGLTAGAQRTSRARGIASVRTAYGPAGSRSAPGISGTFHRRMYWAAGVALFKPASSGFSVSAAPASVPVTAGFPASTTVRTTVTGGTAQPVALDVSGLPAGTSASFSPAKVSAGEPSTLTLHTSVSTPPGAATLTVTGAGSSSTASTTMSLQVAAPSAIRAAFYYPWFPQTWGSLAAPHTNYLPSNGFYSSDDLTVVRRHVADMQYGGITLGLASWWGQGSSTDQHLPALMQAAAGTGFQWAPYYEPEGVGDPSPQQIADDLHYLWTTYHATADSPLASLPGRGMVVFVYNTDDPTTTKGCDTVDRWLRARQLLHDQYGQSVYIDLKVFPGYTTCAGTSSIDGWHQYGPASELHDFSTAPGDGSVSISPGYWKRDTTYGTAPFLARDRSRWQSDITRMLDLHPFWQLITTYNEWGEGTAIESSSGCSAPAPAGTYCDWSGDGSHSDFVTDLHDVPPE
ncbi:MAG TPA: hypothetical protein VFR99_00735 [Marmoricola sp.]|nr:hypothetical protein [Marmoricola sp.]